MLCLIPTLPASAPARVQTVEEAHELGRRWAMSASFEELDQFAARREELIAGARGMPWREALVEGTLSVLIEVDGVRATLA